LKNSFWKDVLGAYLEFVEKIPIISMEMLLEMPLFYNQYMLMDRKPIFIKSWYDKGIRFIKDIMNVNDFP
jgi:hypothetical protein